MEREGESAYEQPVRTSLSLKWEWHSRSYQASESFRRCTDGYRGRPSGCGLQMAFGWRNVL